MPVRSRLALLVALGVDNFGSGLFLPLALVYVTRVVGLPLGVAGTAVSVGTAAGLLAPPIAGRLVDRVGPRPVVIIAQLVQAAGAFTYLAADGATLVVAAAVLLAAGQQTFYSSMFALIADVSADGPTDRSFVVAGMVRDACFGAAGLLVGGLLSVAGPVGFTCAVAVDGGSFVLCALLLAVLVHPVDNRAHRKQDASAGTRPLWRDRPYLALIAIATLTGLPLDFFLVGIPVYSLNELRGPVWLPGAILATLTVISCTGGTVALRCTRRLRRTTAVAIGTGCSAVWCVACLAAVVVPAGWRPAYLVTTTLIIGVGGLFAAGRLNALAEASAPRAARGRYLAAFQYAFTAAGIVAPGVVALFAVAGWLPWVIVAACCFAACCGLRWLAARLPAGAVAPPPTPIRVPQH